MSYDIRFGVKVAGAENVYAVIGEPEYGSPTYNVGRIFRAACDWDFDQGVWYPVAEVLPHIERGIHELRFNASAYKRMEPDNGWGSTSTALKALESIVEWLTKERQWAWNADVPLECIYISW